MQVHVHMVHRRVRYAHWEPDGIPATKGPKSRAPVSSAHRLQFPDPTTALIQGTDGNLYGTTYWGGGDTSCGPAGCGTAFQITLSGCFTTLHRFKGVDGNGPDSSLVQPTSGLFYGTTSFGGTVIVCKAAAPSFSLDIGLKRGVLKSKAPLSLCPASKWR